MSELKIKVLNKSFYIFTDFSNLSIYSNDTGLDAPLKPKIEKKKWQIKKDPEPIPKAKPKTSSSNQNEEGVVDDMVYTEEMPELIETDNEWSDDDSDSWDDAWEDFQRSRN